MVPLIYALRKSYACVSWFGVALSFFLWHWLGFFEAGGGPATAQTALSGMALSPRNIFLVSLPNVTGSECMVSAVPAHGVSSTSPWCQQYQPMVSAVLSPWCQQYQPMVSAVPAHVSPRVEAAMF